MARKQTAGAATATRSERSSREQQERVPISIVEQTPPELQQQIRELAYQLYEQRGRLDGRAEQDWIEAEAIILGKREKLIA